MPPKENESDIWVPCIKCVDGPPETGECLICNGYGGFWIDDPYADEADLLDQLMQQAAGSGAKPLQS